MSYVGEICNFCGERITHPEVYVYECLGCGLKFKMHPVAIKSKTVEILNKSKYKEKMR